MILFNLLTVLKKIDAEDAYGAFMKFRSKFASGIDKAIEMVCRWIEEARKSKYGSKVDSVLASARENLRKAIELMKERIDEFGERVFKTGKVFNNDVSVKKEISYIPKKLTHGTPEHKGQRWKDYVEAKGKWSYERWSKQYDINMKNYKFGLEREIEYRKVLGGTNGTRKTPYTNRQIDILKESEGYMGQLKTGKLYLTEQVKLDLKKDAYFVNKGFLLSTF